MMVAVGEGVDVGVCDGVKVRLGVKVDVDVSVWRGVLVFVDVVDARIGGKKYP